MITNDIQLCRDALTNGELVAFPTETVFGLGARSDSKSAVEKIFVAKDRPRNHPLIAHCADIDVALAISPGIPQSARLLAQEFWPGPMTLVFKRAKADAICDESVGGSDTVAIRVPSHPVARKLLEPLGFFVSAPSANRFGRVSPTTPKHVLEEFGEKMLILNGEQSEVGLESTIISCVNEHPQILRAGAITPQDILRVTGHDVTKGSDEDSGIRVPGALKSHYAPRIDVIIIKSEEEINEYPQFNPERSALLSFSEPTQRYRLQRSMQTYEEFAHELYSFFREAEKNGCDAIFVVAPEEQGIGIAINDRLRKASAYCTASL